MICKTESPEKFKLKGFYAKKLINIFIIIFTLCFFSSTIKIHASNPQKVSGLFNAKNYKIILDEKSKNFIDANFDNNSKENSVKENKLKEFISTPEDIYKYFWTDQQKKDLFKNIKENWINKICSADSLKNLYDNIENFSNDNNVKYKKSDIPIYRIWEKLHGSNYTNESNKYSLYPEEHLKNFINSNPNTFSTTMPFTKYGLSEDKLTLNSSSYIIVNNHDIKKSKTIHANSGETWKNFFNRVKQEAYPKSNGVNLTTNEQKNANTYLENTCYNTIKQVSPYMLRVNRKYSSCFSTGNITFGGKGGFKLNINLNYTIDASSLSYSNILARYSNINTGLSQILYTNLRDYINKNAKSGIFNELSKELIYKIKDEPYNNIATNLKQNLIDIVDLVQAPTFHQLENIKASTTGSTNGSSCYVLEDILKNIVSDDYRFSRVWGKASEAYLRSAIDKVYYNKIQNESSTYCNELITALNLNSSGTSNAKRLENAKFSDGTNLFNSYSDNHLNQSVILDDYDFNISVSGKNDIWNRILKDNSNPRIKLQYFTDERCTNEIKSNNVKILLTSESYITINNHDISKEEKVTARENESWEDFFERVRNESYSSTSTNISESERTEANVYLENCYNEIKKRYFSNTEQTTGTYIKTETSLCNDNNKGFKITVNLNYKIENSNSSENNMCISQSYNSKTYNIYVKPNYKQADNQNGTFEHNGNYYGYRYDTVYIKVTAEALQSDVTIKYPDSITASGQLAQAPLKFYDNSGAALDTTRVETGFGKATTSQGEYVSYSSVIAKNGEKIIFKVIPDKTQIDGFTQECIKIKDGQENFAYLKYSSSETTDDGLTIYNYEISNFFNDNIELSIDTSNWEWNTHTIAFENNETGRWYYNLGVQDYQTYPKNNSGGEVYGWERQKNFTPYTTPIKVRRNQPIAAMFVPNIGYRDGIYGVGGDFGIKYLNLNGLDVNLKSSGYWRVPNNINNLCAIKWDELEYENCTVTNKCPSSNHPGSKYPRILPYTVHSDFFPRGEYGFCFHDIREDCTIKAENSKKEFTVSLDTSILDNYDVSISEIKQTNIAQKIECFVDSDPGYEGPKEDSNTSKIEDPVETITDVKIIDNGNFNTATTTTTIITNLDTFPEKLQEGDKLSFVIKADNSNEIDISKITVTANGTEIIPINGIYNVSVYSDTNINFTVDGENIIKKYHVNFTSQNGIMYSDIKGEENSTTFNFDASLNTASDLYNKPLQFKINFSEDINDNNVKIKARNTLTGIEQTITPDSNGIYTMTFDANYAIFVDDITVNQFKIKLKKDDKLGYFDQYGLNELEYDSSSTDSEYFTHIIEYDKEFSFTIKSSYGYDVSNISVYCKPINSGENVEPILLEPDNELSSSNSVAIKGVYKIPVSVTQDYEIYCENAKPIEYKVELRAPSGITYIDSSGKPMDLNFNMSYGETLSFMLSIDEDYNHSTPKVKVKGSDNEYTPSSDGLYNINISGDIIVEVTDIVKNTYRVTFNKVEGVIYKTAKGKEFEEYLDVDYGTNLEFRITLMDAYDESIPKVMLNGSEAVANNAGLYSVSNINNDLNIVVENVFKNPEEMTIEEIVSVPENISSSSDVATVIQATKAYDNLSDEEKSLVTNIANLEEAQEQAKNLNHKSEGAIVTGVDWNIKLVVKSLNDNQEAIDALNSELERKTLLSLYEMKLVNLLTGESYEVPYGQEVSVSIPCPDLTEYQNIAVVHKNSAGGIEYLDVNIDSDTAYFTTSSFSQFGIAAKKIPNYAEDVSDIKISVASLVEDDNELKNLLGEGVTSQIGELINTDNIDTYSNKEYLSPESDESVNITSSPELSKIYKWAIQNEFVAVVIVLLFGILIITLILLLSNKKSKNQKEK